MIFHALSDSLHSLRHASKRSSSKQSVAAIAILVVLVLALTPPAANADGSSSENLPSDTITVIGGKAASIADHPYMVGLYVQYDGEEDFLCTGTIIDPEWILTAAHCVDAPRELLAVYSGISNLAKRTSANSSLVLEKIVHPAFRFREEGLLFDHDIALLRLAQPFVDATSITLSGDQAGPRAGVSAVTIGWGVTEKSPAGGVLQKVAVPILASPDSPTCTRYGRWIFHSGSMVCAGDLELQSSACYGDSGGPLSIEVAGEMHQVGITSFGQRCASETHGVAYVRVSTYLPWISLMMGTTDGCTIVGTEDGDVLLGTPGDDVICGLGGDDDIRGFGGNDIILGHGGDDILRGGAGTDKLFGASGNDRIDGGAGHDFLEGSSGNDVLTGGPGSDTLLAGYANDVLFGGDGRDFLAGGTGNDRLRGGNGRDLLFGGFDKDNSRGGAGRDVCHESEVWKSCRRLD